MNLETTGYYALGIPFFFACVAWEAAVARKRGVSVYPFAATLGNLAAGLGELIVGLFIGDTLLGLYAFGEKFALVRWPENSPVPWVLAFLLADLGYYIYHRAGHAVAGLWAIHGVHHQTEEFNLSVAARHPWFSDFYSAIFYAPIPLFGVSSLQFFVAISLISFYSLSIHSKVFRRPGLWAFTTPQTHILHHATNPRYMNHNYGAMFTLWDRLFGTHAEPDPAEPPRLGTPTGYLTHDGAEAQVIFFKLLWAQSKAATTWGDRLRVWVRHPGWRPAGAQAIRMPVARPDAAIPAELKRWALVQFALAAGFATALLWLRGHHPAWVLYGASASVVWALSATGGLLDGRAGALAREPYRLGAAVLFGARLLTEPGYGLTAALLLTASLASLGAWWARKPQLAAT